jgi:hypothetical protein
VNEGEIRTHSQEKTDDLVSWVSAIHSMLVTDLTSPGFVRCIVSIYGQTLDAQLEQRGSGCPRATEADRLSDDAKDL